MVRDKGRFVGREWPVEDLRRWLEEEGRTHQWVGEQLSCSPKSVSFLAKKLGIRCQRRGPRSGPGHPKWKGGIRYQKGYRWIWVGKEYPGANQKGWMAEHRWMMQRFLGRPLTPTEVVHHRNGKILDNRMENLALFGSNAEHLREERRGRVPNWSEEGKKKILEGVARSKMIRRQKRDADRSPQTRFHSTDESDTGPLRLCKSAFQRNPLQRYVHSMMESQTELESPPEPSPRSPSSR